MRMPTREQILEALKVVIDPELRRDIVELEMVRSIDIKDGGVVDVTVSLTTPGCPIKSHFQTAVADAVAAVDGVTARQRRLRRAHRPARRPALQRKLGRPAGCPRARSPQVANVICIGSGKGGVGKSSLTVNLAAALAAEGKTRRRARRRRLGLLDPAHARPRRRSARRSRPSARSSRSRRTA